VSELGSDLAAADKLPASTTRTKVTNAAKWSIVILSHWGRQPAESYRYRRISKGSTVR
jgi:hypothetical protein